MVYTKDEHDKLTPFKRFPEKECLKVICDLWYNEPLLLVPKSRQLMMTWLFAACYLWDTQFHEGRLNFFQSKKEDDADRVVQRAWFIYDHQPDWIKAMFPADYTFCHIKFRQAKSEIWGVPMGGDQIRSHTASGIFCLGENVKILTKDLKWIKAKDVELNQELIGFDESGVSVKSNGEASKRQWRNTKVEQIVKIIRPCYRLVFENGKEIICSSEHKWLNGYGQRWKWSQTKDLRSQNGDRAGSRIIKLVDTWEEDKSYDAGYLAGLFDGEGCLGQKLLNDKKGLNALIRLSVSQNEGLVSNYLRSMLISRGFTYQLIQNKRYTKDHHTYRTGIKSEIIKILGQIRPIRLLDKLDFDKWGSVIAQEGLLLIDKKFIGNQEVIGIKTSTGTFVAEGLASHNSDEMAFQPEAEDAYTGALPTIKGGGRFTGVSSANPGFFHFLVENKI